MLTGSQDVQLQAFFDLTQGFLRVQAQRLQDDKRQQSERDVAYQSLVDAGLTRRQASELLAITEYGLDGPARAFA